MITLPGLKDRSHSSDLPGSGTGGGPEALDFLSGPGPVPLSMFFDFADCGQRILSGRKPPRPEIRCPQARFNISVL